MMRSSRQTGSALIEFAFSLIVLATLLTGIFQAGYTFYTYESLIDAARCGARYASLRASGSSSDIAQSVRNMVVFGDPNPPANAKRVVPGLEPSDVELALEPNTATVSVRGYVIDALFAKVQLDGRPTVTFPIAPGAGR